VHSDFPNALYKVLVFHPLDCTDFGPYKTYYKAYVNDWMLSNVGGIVIIYSDGGIIGRSFSKAFTKQDIGKGCHVTEFIQQMKIFLIKINSYVTDRPYSLVTE
jgi:hypothetical protein